MKTLISVKIDPELLARLRRQAKRHRRTQISIFEEGVELVVKRLEKKEA